MSKPCKKCGGTERARVSRNCVACKKAYDKVYRRQHKARLQVYDRNWALQKNHGITAKQWDAMLIAQAGRCAICGGSFQPNWWAIHVDHDHETDGVRGLLCAGCNKALGRFGDNLSGVLRVVAYLEGGRT